MKPLLILTALALISCAATADPAAQDDRDFLVNPPVYIVSEPDLPLAALGAFVPPPGKVVFNFEGASIESESWRLNDQPVQPDLFVKQRTIRVGALYGIEGGWAAGISIPQTRILVGGQIGGQPATRTVTGFGEPVLVAKKVLWQRGEHERMTFAVGIEPPTGKDGARFDQRNSSTDAYYPTDPGRLPISWQPSPGSTNAVFGVSYSRYAGRLSYAGLFVVKYHGRGFEDSGIGNITLLSGAASYGLARWCAASLGLTLRFQSDDSYPNVNVNQPALAGTTLHGATLYVTPSLRFLVAGRVVVGVDARFPVVKPDDGLVARVRVNLIFYPEF